MKKSLFLFLIFFYVAALYSQDTFHETEMEVDMVVPSEKSCLFEASFSIKLKEGFYSNPSADNDVCLRINRYGVFPPAAGLEGGPSPSSDGVVGALPSIVNVSDLGGLIYSIPVQVPVGIANMTPNIGITYNSQSSNGILGWGWNISGLSAIKRVGKTLYHDGETSSVNFKDDRYSLDGHRLIVCSGEYGANGSEYKTELDEMSRIVAYSKGGDGPSYFIVNKADGTTWEYGNSEDTRLQTKNRGDRIITWFVNKIVDADGNYMVFKYLENTDTGESYIDEIEYTLNDKAGIASMYSVCFCYENRVDPEVCYVAGNEVQNNKILKNIVVKNSSNAELFNYSFDYLEPGVYGNNKKFLYYRLNSIGLTVDGMKLNPTIINWNKENKHYNADFQSFPLEKMAFNKVPFVGDFNGDGYSDVLTVPYKTGEVYNDDVIISMLLNNGDGTFRSSPSWTQQIDNTLDWIYVADINGDYLDDIVAYFVNPDNGPWKTRIKAYLNNGDCSFSYIGGYYSDTPFNIFPGKFGSQTKTSFFVRHYSNSSNYDASVLFFYGGTVEIQNLGKFKSISDSERFLVEDVDGDGLSEVFCMNPKNTVVANILFKGGQYSFVEKFTDNNLCSNDFVFPGDFNGDGYSDFLKYNVKTNWTVMLSDGILLKTPVNCKNNSILGNIALQPYDRYECSLKTLSAPAVTMRVADFDGDGKSDVGAFRHSAGNYYMLLGTKMIRQSDGSYGFADIRRNYFNINNSNQFVHVGNFLGRENASVLASVHHNPYSAEVPKIVSLFPQSSKYSVERITDGLGNARGFQYEYLMPNKQDSFYGFNLEWMNDDLKTTTLPVRAIFSDTTFSVNNNPCVTRYFYENAMHHVSGHGIIGFKKQSTKHFINNSFSSSTVIENEVNTLNDESLLLPEKRMVYNNVEQLVEKEEYHYDKYSCTKNKLVVMPLLILKSTAYYDPDCSGSVLKVVVENRVYDSDNKGHEYYDIVNLNRVASGFDDKNCGDDAEMYRYWIENTCEFDNDLSGWIVSRPKIQKCIYHSSDSDDVGSCDIFEYEQDNPYHVRTKTSLPNTAMNFSDKLKVTTDYSYDVVGHVVMQTITSPSSKKQKTTRLVYGENYLHRFPTSAVNEKGWVINNSFDNDFGMVQSSVDYNGFNTYCDSDPFEITTEILLPDGVKNVKTKRWAKENKHCPQNAMYFYWEKTAGKSENLSFFAKNGNIVREVAFGLDGEAIYVDTEYDDRGNVASKTMPYFAGDEVKKVYFSYDDNNRLIKQDWPNGVVKNYRYDKNRTTIQSVSADGIVQTFIEETNPMGWVSKVIDIGGNEIVYSYYSDGKLKNTVINNNVSTKVMYEYDGRRNLNKMIDPSCGEITYQYNAFGELVEVRDSNHGVTEYQYDELGMMTFRSEYKSEGDEKTDTRWFYDMSKGKRGTLSRVVYGNIQDVEYEYDDLLRLTSVVETVLGKQYKTQFQYDGANRESIITYPNGFSIQKKYSNTGYYKSMVRIDDEMVLWNTNSIDALGNITDYQVGNGLRTVREFDNRTNQVGLVHTSKSNKVYQNDSYHYDSFGNMTDREKNAGNHQVESFVYDEYNRLSEIRLNGALTGRMVYDDYGNILSKTSDNVTVYFDARYDEGSPYSISRAKTNLNNINSFEHDITYTTFNKTHKICNGGVCYNLDYGYDYQRVRSVEQVDGKVKEKVYIGDCEFVNDNGKDEIDIMLKSPMGVFAVCRFKGDGSNDVFYIHKDHLESWSIITDGDGVIIQDVSYDAWGNPRNSESWCGEYTRDLEFDRGFAGQEVVACFGVINMNGRMYDPLVSVMMSPDRYIQSPDFSQNYNRYSYCLDNPLKYYDPTGYWIEWVAYGLFSGVVNVVTNIDDVDNLGEGAMLFGAGFVKGCLMNCFASCSWGVQMAGAVVGSVVKAGVNNYVKQNAGSNSWANINKDELKEEMLFAFGYSLTSSVLNANIYQPEGGDESVSLITMINEKYPDLHVVETSVATFVGNVFSGRIDAEGFSLSSLGIELSDVLPVLSDVVGTYLIGLEDGSGFFANIISFFFNMGNLLDGGGGRENTFLVLNCDGTPSPSNNSFGEKCSDKKSSSNLNVNYSKLRYVVNNY